MSIATLCNRDSVSVARLVTTQGTAGGQVRTHTAAARGSLATSYIGRLQEIEADEKREFGVRAERRAWKYFDDENPSLTVEDQVSFTDPDGIDHTARVFSPSRNFDGQSRLWMAILEEVTTER